MTSSGGDDLSLLGRALAVVGIVWIGGVGYALMRVDGWTAGAGAILGVLFVAFARTAYRESAFPELYGRTESKSPVEPLVRSVAACVLLFGPMVRWLLEEQLRVRADATALVNGAIGITATLGLVVGFYLWIVRDLARDAIERRRRETA